MKYLLNKIVSAVIIIALSIMACIGYNIFLIINNIYNKILFSAFFVTIIFVFIVLFIDICTPNIINYFAEASSVIKKIIYSKYFLIFYLILTMMPIFLMLLLFVCLFFFPFLVK